MNRCKINSRDLWIANEISSNIRCPDLRIDSQSFWTFRSVKTFKAHGKKMVPVDFFYKSRHFFYPILQLYEIRFLPHRTESCKKIIDITTCFHFKSWKIQKIQPLCTQSRETWEINIVKTSLMRNLPFTWSVSPDLSVIQRGSLINSHPKIVGSSLYSTPVNVFLLVRTVCQKTRNSKVLLTDILKRKI